MVDDASLLGDGSVSDMLWARPAVTVLGIDCPPVVGSASAIVPQTAARLNLRIPPGTEPEEAQTALRDHLLSVAPWDVKVTVTPEAAGAPFRAEVDGPAYRAIAEAMEQAYGVPMATLGQGGSIPLSNVFPDTFPAAEIILMGLRSRRPSSTHRTRASTPPRSRGWRWPRPSSSSATPAPASSPWRAAADNGTTPAPRWQHASGLENPKGGSTSCSRTVLRA